MYTTTSKAYKKVKDLDFPCLFNGTLGWLALFFFEVLIKNLIIGLAMGKVEFIGSDITITFSGYAS